MPVACLVSRKPEMRLLNTESAPILVSDVFA